MGRHGFRILQYQNGDVYVSVGTDVFVLPGVPAATVTLGVALNEDPYFQRAPYDGMLGLGLDALVRTNSHTVMDQLISQAGLQPVFSLFFVDEYQRAVLKEADLLGPHVGRARRMRRGNVAALGNDDDDGMEAEITLGGWGE